MERINRNIRWMYRPATQDVNALSVMVFTLCAFMIGCGEGGEPLQSFQGVMCAENVDCKLGFVCEQARCQRLDLVDEDGDGISDSEEQRLGTNPRRADSDRDGIPDTDELIYDEATRTYSARDSDEDGIIDARESAVKDRDNDGIADPEDPCDADPDCPIPRPEPAACLMDEGEPCVVGIGTCRRVGVTVCSDDMMEIECVGDPGMPSMEICDDKDNDCDGIVDNDVDVSADPENCGGCGIVCDVYENSRATCTEGECGTSCLPDTYDYDDEPGCEYTCTPSEDGQELCNGLDEDCDGLTDETNDDAGPDSDSAFRPLTQECGSNVGQCERGRQTCVDAVFGPCEGERVESAEVCDGLDNDCDGTVDNGFDLMTDPENCGACDSVCPNDANTLATCIDGQCQLSCLPNTYDYDNDPGCEYECIRSANETEQCNGADDDCDGQVDEEFDLTTDIMNCGACDNACPTPENTTVLCETGQCVFTCMPNTYDYDDEPDCEYACMSDALAVEICNGIDDDCDGQTDEAFAGIGSPCSVGEGACISRGVLVCTEDEIGLVCNAPIKDGGPERCDGIDNDCDDNIDEDFILGGQCQVGIGACEQPGTIQCNPATGEPHCQGIQLPATPEVCDGVDNDCDGLTDEGEAFANKGAPCQTGVGECVRMGQFACTADGRSTECSIGDVDGSGELCNGQDDDCDGRTDEAFDLGTPCVRGDGECARAGTRICAPDGQNVVCDAEVPVGDMERCDGIDNDCDLAVDEDFPTKGDACTVGVGQCRAIGNQICTDDGLSLVCDAVEGAVSPEICDNFDNDCDGEFNEGFANLGERCTVGLGACADTGRIICSDDGLSALCSKEPKPAEDERCNGRDDDCDGEIDEIFGNIDQACSVGTGACRREGTIECRADFLFAECNVVAGLPDGPEQCNDIDDDCDGNTDEDFNATCDLLAADISTGGYESCAITSTGDVRCWGDSKDTPPNHRFITLSGGNNFHCGTTDDAHLKCWGNFELSEAGAFDMIAAGDSLHVCGIAQATGLPACWGQQGQANALVLTPPAIPMKNISSGQDFSCGLRMDNGHATCWGVDVFDSLAAPQGVAYVDLDSGGNNSCAIRDNGEGQIDCWGLNFNGILDVPDGEYRQVSVGDGTACAIKTDSTLVCWGRGQANEANQFGQAVPPAGLYSKVSVGSYHACAMRQGDGAIDCWGAGQPPYNDDNLIHWGQSTPP